MSEVKGTVFDIRRYSTQDGPGIRTTVFFKGCPLRCRWCHNPESQEPSPRLISRKIRIGATVLTGEEWCGRQMAVSQVMEEVERDRPFYDESGGGITFSGGEPFLQPDFLLALLMECRRRNLHCCVDTCGHVDPGCLKKLARWVDLFLLDIKLIDPTVHRLYTGLDNEVILGNFHYLRRESFPVIIRFPLIPGYTDARENIDRIAEMIAGGERHPAISILPYHSMSEDKYRRLGISPQHDPIQAPSGEQMAAVVERFTRLGLQAHIGG